MTRTSFPFRWQSLARSCYNSVMLFPGWGPGYDHNTASTYISPSPIEALILWYSLNSVSATEDRGEGMGAPCCYGSCERVRPVEIVFFPELATSGGHGDVW